MQSDIQIGTVFKLLSSYFLFNISSADLECSAHFAFNFKRAHFGQSPGSMETLNLSSFNGEMYFVNKEKLNEIYV